MPRRIYKKPFLLQSHSPRTIGSLEFLPVCPSKPVVSTMSILIRASTWMLQRQGYSSETFEAARQKGRRRVDSIGVKAIVLNKHGKKSGEREDQ